MKKNEKRTLKLGILVIGGLVIFTTAIYFLGSRQNLFTSSVTVKSYFNDVAGLAEGNKVRYSGITVGSVSEISIVSDSSILVAMTVDKKVRDYIRKNSKVAINSDGLMGSKIINILPGTADAGSVADGDFLVSVDPVDLQDILEEAKMVINDSKSITNNLVEITYKINNGDGDLARLLNENNVTTRLNNAGDKLVETAEKVYNITEKIDNGEGDLGRLVNDTVITDGMQQLMDNFTVLSNKTDSISNQLLIFSKGLNSGDGIISQLVYNEDLAENIDTTIVKVNNGIDDVVRSAKTIEKSWIFNLFSKKKK